MLLKCINYVYSHLQKSNLFLRFVGVLLGNISCTLQESIRSKPSHNEYRVTQKNGNF